MPSPTVNDVHRESTLDNISIAYKNMNYIWRQVSPLVPVEKKSDYYFTYDRAAWFRDEVEVRAPGTKSALVDYTLSSASYICINYALAKIVTDEERNNSDAPLRPDSDATEFVTDKLELATERRVATLVTTCGNWASASNPGTKWDNDASDPLNDFETMKNAVISQTGVEPNVCIISRDTWRFLRKHPDVLDRVKYTMRGGVVTPALFSELVEIPKILIGNSIYNTAREGVTDSMSYVWGDMAWVGYVPANPGLRIPSALYTFQWQGNQVYRYRLAEEHADKIEVMQYVDEVIAGSIAGAIMSDCSG